MNPSKLRSELESLASEYESRLQAVRQLQQIAQQFPDLLEALLHRIDRQRQALPESGAASATFPHETVTGPIKASPGVSGDEPDGTVFDRICQLFHKNENRPMSVKEIAERTALKGNSVAYVIYHSHNASFVKDGKKGPTTYWRLREATDPWQDKPEEEGEGEGDN